MEKAKEIDQVKRKIWSFGFKCKDVSDISDLDYDLLVKNDDGDEFQVRVARKSDPVENIGNKVILALVDGDSINYQICKRGSCREETSPLRAFSS